MKDNAGPIVPPKSHPARAIGRGVAQGLIELIPGASLLTNIYAVTHPPIEEVEREHWEQNVSRRSNEQDELLKRVIGAFLQMKSNHQQAGNAQQLSFVRGGMISTLEGIAREGLSPRLEEELHRKMENTSKDVEELLQGLDAALLNMSDDPRNLEFADTLREVVFGAFGKSTIRTDIDRLLKSRERDFEEQRQWATRICESIDRFNAGLAKLSHQALAAVNL
ncbi:hypothetical protein GOB50_30940 [Sinorhizobium meliloti]|nr:hypothetical protein [Sinorhizobium meliloti]